MSQLATPTELQQYLADNKALMDSILEDYKQRHRTPSQREFVRTLRNTVYHVKTREVSDDYRLECLLLAQCVLALLEHCIVKKWFVDNDATLRADYLGQVGLPPRELQQDQWLEVLDDTFLFPQCTQEDFFKEFYPVMRVPASEPSGLWGILDSMPLTLGTDEYMRLGREMIQAAQNVRR